MIRANSEKLYEEACLLIPGGVNSPVRAFKGVGGTPVFFENAQGAYLTDVDGNKYVDYVCSWGAIIHGHADPSIQTAILDAASHGTSYGAPHAGEVALAREVCQRMQLDLVRFVNSGTEATLSVIRLARAATNRKKILKFEGCYHGAVDSLLAKAGSGVATLGIPDSAGVNQEVTQDTVLATYGSIESVEQAFQQNPTSIAAILVEPIAGNMGYIDPGQPFLQALREIATQYGALLIFDEVMTGFRVGPAGVSGTSAVKPDLVCLGKVIGGGLPVGAYGGRKDLMNHIAPMGTVYQAGTLSGNPLAMAAGLKALQKLDESAYNTLNMLSEQLTAGIKQAFERTGTPGQALSCGGMLGIYFSPTPIRNFDEAQTTDKARYAKLFHAMLDKGFYLPPSALEAWFITTSHTSSDIKNTCAAFEESLRETST